MKKRCNRHRLCAVAILTLAGAAPLGAHHSAAAFDADRTEVLTGAVVDFHPDENHVVIYFAPLNETHRSVQRDADGKPLRWRAEFPTGAAMTALEGISVNTFKPGTVFTIALHPSRNGTRDGVRTGPVFRCPDRKPPPPGRHCDSVEGHVKAGYGNLPAPAG